MKPYFDQLTSYKVLMAYGDDETKQKVEEVINGYVDNLVKGAKDGDKWQIDFFEPDEESTIKFKKTIIILTTNGRTKQVELVSDFSFDDKRFVSHVGGNKVRLVSYYEQGGQSMLADADFHSVDIYSSLDGKHLVKSKKGGICGKRSVVKESVIANEEEIEKE